MTFYSMLYETPAARNPENTTRPGYFIDLNLDQIVAEITRGKQEYHLEPFFYTPLHDIDTIHYRHEVMGDLYNADLLEKIKKFARDIRTTLRYLNLAEKEYFHYHKEGWFLEAALVYVNAIADLVSALEPIELKSRGFLAFRRYLNDYAVSADFKAMQAETRELKADLASIKYCVLIKGNNVRVRRYANEIDYSIEIEEIFRKFQQGAVKDYRTRLGISTGMNHVEAEILNRVAKLYPEIFAHLDDYCARHRQFMDKTILVFDREIQFYVAYLDYIERIQYSGLKFCFPRINHQSKEVYDYEGFDLALANLRVTENLPVVTNDFHLQGEERIIVVTGPNQGGKTTFARTFGQLHYLACLGCPVPGSRAQLYLFDQLFTHFEKEEEIKNLRGKLQDDLVRIHTALQQATPDSIFILNEVFNSTTLQDAVFLSKKILEKIIQLDLLCVCVTFIDELASLSEKTISMVSTVEADNPAVRTFKILRRPADGLAYALSIAEKHRLTYANLLERIKP